MWELDHKESWAPKNWCFWIMVLEKTPESPRTARRSNQSILKEINPKYSSKGLMLKLDLKYSGPLMWRAVSLKKTLMLGKIGGRRRRGQQRTRWLDGITNLWTWDWANSSRQWRTGKPGMLQSMGLQRVRHKWVTEQQQESQRVSFSKDFWHFKKIWLIYQGKWVA